MIGILIALFTGLISPVAPPALPHTMFAVTDNQGVLITGHTVTPGQVVYQGGIAETVHAVHVLGSWYEFAVTPVLPASDRGKTIPFST